MEFFDISNPINVKQFVSECRSNLSEYDLCSSNEFVEDKCITYPETFDVSKFSAEKLKPDIKVDSLKSIDNTKGLKLLEYRKAELQRRQKTNKTDKFIRHLSDSPWIHKLTWVGTGYKPPKTEDHVELPDVLMRVHFYRAVREKKSRYTRIQEFEVLGQTHLSSLKELFSCPADHICNHDFAENPDEPVGKIAKDVYKSNFFFIEGTFYNDMSDKKNVDLSAVIKEWADERTDRVGPFKYTAMEGVKFIDLTFKLGHPYLYMHQGDCEHLLIFSDIRVVTDQDTYEVSKYPMETFRVTNRRVACHACCFTAKWIAFNSSYAPDDPGFFCDLCLKMLHYDKQGKLHDKNLKVYLHPFCSGRWDCEDCDEDRSFRKSKAELIYYA